MGSWIGVDFDETLRRADGSPVEAMVSRVRSWLARGLEVRIVTARLAPDRDIGKELALVRVWCVQHLGAALKVQWGKSSGMIELWDDKVVRVQANTGARLSPSQVETEENA